MTLVYIPILHQKTDRQIMVLFSFLLFLGSLYLCNSYVSHGHCPSLEHSDPIANYHYLLSNTSFYTVAYEAHGAAGYKQIYRKRGRVTQEKTYISTRGTDNHCLVTSPEALNKRLNYLIEIGAPLLESVEILLPFLECNQFVMNKTRLWYDSNFLFFWWCFETRSNQSVQNWFIFIPTFLKDAIFSDADRNIDSPIFEKYTMHIKSVAIKYVDKECITRARFDWKAIVMPSIEKKTVAEPPRWNISKIVTIIIFISVFGIILAATIIKMKSN